ncbi:MAG TPA: PilZ domain-containing protein, partial [Kofleriaceae bacterium]
GDLASWSERRRALRVPVRGVAVFYAEDGAMHGTIENLSSSGALVSVAGVPSDENLDVELKLGHESGWVSAKTVRIERASQAGQEAGLLGSLTRGRRWRIAVQFDRVADNMRAAIDGAIEHALRAAQRRPIMVIDDRPARRVNLATRLAARGMTPLAPRTPLEAIDLLTRTQLHVNVCLLAPSFGQSVEQLRALVSDSFPWVTTAEISDDVELTVDRALEAWSGTDVARIAAGIA